MCCKKKKKNSDTQIAVVGETVKTPTSAGTQDCMLDDWFNTFYFKRSSSNHFLFMKNVGIFFIFRHHWNNNQLFKRSINNDNYSTRAWTGLKFTLTFYSSYSYIKSQKIIKRYRNVDNLNKKSSWNSVNPLKCKCFGQIPLKNNCTVSVWVILCEGRENNESLAMPLWAHCTDMEFCAHITGWVSVGSKVKANKLPLTQAAVFCLKDPAAFFRVQHCPRGWSCGSVHTAAGAEKKPFRIDVFVLI